MSGIGNTTRHFFSRIKETTKSVAATRRSWSTFFDPASLNLPASDATTRVTQNLSHFRANYAILLLLLLTFSLIFHPLSLLLTVAMILAWVSLYVTRVEPCRVFGFEVGDSAVLALLIVATVIVAVMGFGGGVWWNVLVAVGVGVVVVGVHALLRSTDDLVGDGSGFGTASYEELLSDVEEGPNHHPRGEFEL